MTLDLRFYFAIFIRRLHYFILVFGAVSALAITAAFTLPPVYYAEARLLIERPQIPDELAAPKVDATDREKLQVIEQRLMTRTNLLDIAKRFDALGDTESLREDQIIIDMVKNTTFFSQAGREQATLMIVGFEAGDAQTTADVVDEYVNLILRDNQAVRTDRAQETLEFFQNEVDRLSAEVSAHSTKILEFQSANADALPDTLDFRLQQQDTLQQRLINIEENITTLNDQKQQLIRLYNATGQVQNAPSNILSPEAQQLASLKDQLNAALAIYSPEHPNVKLLQARVAQLEAVVANQTPDEKAAASPEASLLEIQTDQIDNRIAQQNRQRALIEAQLDELADSIERTSANTITLNALNRDYTNIQDQYNTAVSRMASASAGERIEVLSKGERILVLDEAVVPFSPIRPARAKIAIGGIGAGLALGFGLVVLLEMLNSAIRRPSDLTRSLEISPIGVIPYVHTPGEDIRRRAVVALLLLSALFGLPAAAWLMDAYLMPLDVFIEKLSAKAGF